jgi:DNA (cytosine-5)-methyltransferase 1
MNELALFAGAGGGILGGHLLGWRTVCAVEWEPYAACVLAARQNDGILPHFPIWDDVQTFDGKLWAGRVDVVSGGFPCQDISAAGRGAGIKGTRSGMWFHMARIVGEVRPRYVFVENSPMLTSRGLHRVLGDLAEMGFDAQWGVVSAADVGAPHQRDRIWIVAHSAGPRRDEGSLQIKRSNGRTFESGSSIELVKSSGSSAFVANFDSAQRKGNERTKRSVKERTFISKSSWWDAEPNVGRVANGVAARVDRLKAIGNGQVPAVAATAWRLLNDPA